jgi:hypothetical protein
MLKVFITSELLMNTATLSCVPCGPVNVWPGEGGHAVAVVFAMQTSPTSCAWLVGITFGIAKNAPDMSGNRIIARTLSFK